MSPQLTRTAATLALLAAALPAVHARTTLTLGESSGVAGDTRHVPVRIETTDAVVAIQFDVSRIRGTTADPIPGAAAEGHLFDAGRVQGRLRTIVCTADNSPLASGTLMAIPVHFTDTVGETERSLSLTNVILSDADGTSVHAFLLPFGRITRPTVASVLPDAFIEGLLVEAVALDTGDGVASVEFMANGQSIGITTTAPYSLAWHPTAAGDHLITALVTNRDGNPVELEPKPITVGVPGSYQDWASTYFGDDAANPDVAGRMADPNGNGLPNIFEFAMGRNPRAHNPAGLPVPEIIKVGGADHLALRFRVPTYLQGVSHRVEISDDLITWRSGPGHTVEISEPSGSLMKTVTVRSARPVDPSSGEFMRLTIEVD